jgi:hypothetical protein
MDEPARFLVMPQIQATVDEGYSDPLELFGWISPTHWINEVVIELAGWDVLGWITATFTGNWAAFAACGEAYGNLAQCLQALGINLQQGALQLGQLWSGQAADAAYRPQSVRGC